MDKKKNTNARILLVEDDPADARLIQRAFDKAGIGENVSRLTNGDDAVAYLSGEGPFANRTAYPAPTILLLDIKLPRRSGLEILQWVRAEKNSLLRRIPIIMLTSSRHSTDVNRAYDLGANSYLVKPEGSAELQKMADMFRQYWLEWNEYPAA